MHARSRWQTRLTAVGLGTTLGLAGAAIVLSNLGWAGTPWAGIVEEKAREAKRQEEARQRLAELRARVQPRSPVRGFDLGELRAKPSISAEDEVRALLVDLQRLKEHRLRGARFASTEDAASAAQRLALFRWRFGVPPQEVRGWADVTSLAKVLLADVERDSAPTERAFRLVDADSYDSLVHALLLEVAGRVADADQRLADTTVQHWCGNCADAREVIVRQRRSEAAVRRGDARRAFELIDQGSNGLFQWNGTIDLVVLESHDDAWRGILLLANGRADDGVLVLQQVVDLYPGTAAAEVARVALEQVGALVEPSAQRLHAVYVAGTFGSSGEEGVDGKWQRREALRAYGTYRPEDAFTVLDAWWKSGERTALAGLVELRDERARATFERAIDDRDLGTIGTPLRGLARLQGGLVRYVEPLLTRLARPDLRGGRSGLSAIDDLLRQTFGGGPDFDALDETEYAPFAQAWLDWLTARGERR